MELCILFFNFFISLKIIPRSCSITSHPPRLEEIHSKWFFENEFRIFTSKQSFESFQIKSNIIDRSPLNQITNKLEQEENLNYCFLKYYCLHRFCCSYMLSVFFSGLFFSYIVILIRVGRFLVLKKPRVSGPFLAESLSSEKKPRHSRSSQY